MKELMTMYSKENTIPEFNKPGFYLISGCYHIPFINLQLFEQYCNLMRDLNNTGMLRGHLLIGDVLDMHSISRHNKGKIKIPGLTLGREYAAGNEVLDRFDEIAPDIDKLYIWANHECWYTHYMSEIDNAKLGKDVIKSPTEALHLNLRGYTVLEDFVNAEARVGDISLVHGVWTTKHAAHKHVTELKRNVIFVHTHRMGVWKEGAYEGHNIGWMGNVHAPAFNYMSKQQKEEWRNGFAVVYVDEDKKSHVTQIDWKNNKFIYGGKIYG